MPTSAAINQPYMANLQMYRDKLRAAQAQDAATSESFNKQKATLSVLVKTKNELAAEMPVSAQASELINMPAAVNVKNALENIDAAKKRKADSMAEAVQDLANANTTERLLAVHQGQDTKDNVFAEMKQPYVDKFGKVSEQETLIKDSCKAIAETWESFKLLKQSAKVDPTRQAFFTKLDFALMCQADLENNVHQGQNFYRTLIDHLTNLKQGIQDFKMSRNMQMTDLCSQIGAPAPDFTQSKGPGGPPVNAPPANYEFEIFAPPDQP